MPSEDPQLSLHHIGNARPCRFFNQYEGGCLNGPTCPFMHAPDEHSLRLKLDGGNICEAQLVRIGGCPMGTRCWYSHDLENGASFPVDDAWALKETMERIVRMRKDERRQSNLRGDFVKPRGDGPPALAFLNKCGDEILRELGGRRPVGGYSKQPTVNRYQPAGFGEMSDEPPMDEAMKSMFAPQPPKAKKGPSARPPRQPRRRSPEMGEPGFGTEWETELAMYGFKPGDDGAMDVLDAIDAQSYY